MMRRRSTSVGESASPETATRTPQPECMRNARATGFMRVQRLRVYSSTALLMSKGGPHVLKRKRQRNVWILLPLNLNVRVHEIVQRFAFLRGRKPQVASHAELHTIYIMGSEKVITLLGMLPGFRNVDGNPSLAVDVKV